jgi:hypothetical protein
VQLQAAVDQFLPKPLRELLAVAKLPPIATLSANSFFAVDLHVATGGTPEVLSKRKQLGVLAFSVILHTLNSRYAATVRYGLTGAVEMTEPIRRITHSR